MGGGRLSSMSYVSPEFDPRHNKKTKLKTINDKILRVHGRPIWVLRAFKGGETASKLTRAEGKADSQDS